MCKFWNRLSGNKYQSSAKVVDGSLIISLPDAINPVVWRMELGNVKASAMEVRANDNNHLLTLKTPKGETHDIAPFETREAAIKALMRVSYALEKSQGHMAPVSSSTPSPENNVHGSIKKSGNKKWIFGMVAALILVYVLYALASSTPVSVGATATDTSAQPAQGESGVPQSADEYLRGF